MSRYSYLAPTILRLGLSFVVLWFGLHEVSAPDQWISFIPGWVIGLSGLTAHTVVILNGVAEIVLGALLACGLWVRPVAILLALHMLLIVIDVGVDAIGVRDIGLLLGFVSVAFTNADRYSFKTR